MKKSFSFTFTIYPEDVDSFGIVHHAHYLKFMERARTAWLYQQGFRFDHWISQGILFVIHKAELKFLKPARLYDRLEIISQVVVSRRTTKVYEQVIRLQEHPQEIICTGVVHVVCVNEKLRPRPLPPEVVESM